jgi:hypothetical protein
LDFSAEYLQSNKGRQTLPWLWTMDMVFRPIMLAFNYSVWVTFRNVQTGNLCPRGSGSIFLFGLFDVSVKSGVTLAALIICGLDVVGEVLRYVGEITRCQLLAHRPRDLVDELVFDSRVWWISRIMAARFRPNWKWICWWTLRVSFLYSILLCLLLLISVEKTVSVNEFGSMEGWGFGQMFVMLDTLALFIFVCCRRHLRGTSIITFVGPNIASTGSAIFASLILWSRLDRCQWGIGVVGCSRHLGAVSALHFQPVCLSWSFRFHPYYSYGLCRGSSCIMFGVFNAGFPCSFSFLSLA